MGPNITRLPPKHWPMSWFTRRRSYRLFMLREMTSFFVAGYLVFLLVVLARVGESTRAYEHLLAALRSPVSQVLHAVALAAALFHSVTWFNLSPRIMPVRIGEDPLPGPLIAIGAGYLPWAVVSLVVGWFLFR